MKKFFSLIFLIVILTSTCIPLFIACNKPIPSLQTPNIQRNGTELTWNSVKNAVEYVIKAERADGSYKEYSEQEHGKFYLTMITESGDYIIKVKAVGNQTSYIDSDWSNEITYGVLSAPLLWVDGTMLRWNEIPNATHYTVYFAYMFYKDVTTTEFSLELSLISATYPFSVWAFDETGIYGSSPHSRIECKTY